jgi:hypothetical protein
MANETAVNTDLKNAARIAAPKKKLRLAEQRSALRSNISSKLHPLLDRRLFEDAVPPAGTVRITAIMLRPKPIAFAVSDWRSQFAGASTNRRGHETNKAGGLKNRA